VLGILSAIGVLATWLLWPSHDPEILPHRHEELPGDHPHLAEHGLKHEHAVVIDAWHPKWPIN